MFAKVLSVVGDGLREASEFGLEPSFHRTDWLLRWGLSIAYNYDSQKSFRYAILLGFKIIHMKEPGDNSHLTDKSPSEWFLSVHVLLTGGKLLYGTTQPFDKTVL